MVIKKFQNFNIYIFYLEILELNLRTGLKNLIKMNQDQSMRQKRIALINRQRQARQL